MVEINLIISSMELIDLNSFYLKTSEAYILQSNQPLKVLPLWIFILLEIEIPSLSREKLADL
jgi:hypothetical protein